jgi:hypothetical protein
MIRLIAFITMAIDHIGLVLFPQYLIFRAIGRLAFPLFALGIARGYGLTRDVSKYGQRIFLLALFSQPIFYLTISRDYLNICFTLLLGLVAIYIYDKSKNLFLKYFGILAILFIGDFLNVEYGVYGILTVLLFFVFKDGISMLISQSLLVFSYVLIDHSSVAQILSLGAIFLIFFAKDFNIKMSRTVKYLFYPLHLLIIYIVYHLLY